MSILSIEENDKLSELKEILILAAEHSIEYFRQSKSDSSRGFSNSIFTEIEFPNKGKSISEVYSRSKDLFYGQPQFLNQHNGFMGWSIGTGREMNLLSSLMTATVNASVQTSAQTSARVEIELGDWMKKVFDWPQEGVSYLLSGTAQGNLIALIAARINTERKIECSDDQNKVQLVAIGSDQAHVSFHKSMRAIGLGESQFIQIPTGRSGKMTACQIENAIGKLKSNQKVFCIISTLGSTVSGSFDSISDANQICKKYDVWHHVDAAWGAWTRLDRTRRYLTEDINLADSLAFDFHKLPGSAIGSGMILFKPELDVKSVFFVDSPYLQSMSGAKWQYSDLGLEFTRPMRALAPWMIIQQYGFEEIGRQITCMLDLTKLFAEELNNRKNIEQPFDLISNTVVFSFKNTKFGINELDQFTKDFADLLWKKGRFMPSLLSWNSKLYLRFSLMNPNLTESHLRELLIEVDNYIIEKGL